MKELLKKIITEVPEEISRIRMSRNEEVSEDILERIPDGISEGIRARISQRFPVANFEEISSKISRRRLGLISSGNYAEILGKLLK